MQSSWHHVTFFCGVFAYVVARCTLLTWQQLSANRIFECRSPRQCAASYVQNRCMSCMNVVVAIVYCTQSNQLVTVYAAAPPGGSVWHSFHTRSTAIQLLAYFCFHLKNSSVIYRCISELVNASCVSQAGWRNLTYAIFAPPRGYLAHHCTKQTNCSLNPMEFLFSFVIHVKVMSSGGGVKASSKRGNYLMTN